MRIWNQGITILEKHLSIKMKRNEQVSMAIILNICEVLDCNMNVAIKSSDQRSA